MYIFECLIHISDFFWQVVVTNSVPQEQSKARLGSLLDIVDISGTDATGTIWLRRENAEIKKSKIEREKSKVEK